MDRNLLEIARIPDVPAAEWRAVSKADEGRDGFVGPVSAVEVDGLTDEEVWRWRAHQTEPLLMTTAAPEHDVDESNI